MLRTRLAVAGYLTAILWVNIYICREIFFVEHSGYMNSMHGFWMAMARLADGAWFQPSWWPYWDAGMPFEHTYAPGIPASMAALARVSGISAARAFHVIAGLVYCLGPLTLFIMAWRLSGAPGYSFAAALFYSLAAPTQLVVPDARFSWRSFLDPRRLELAFVWDEVPHLAALAVLPVCVLLLVLAWREGRVRWLVAAGLAMAAMVLANAFGGTMLVMAALPALFTFGRDHLRRNAVWLAVTGAAAYLAISPFLPPSLLAAIAANTALDPESTWTAASWLGLGVVLAGCVALYKITRRWVEDAFLQFVLLFAWIASSPPLLATYAGWRFLPQANRYKQEMELALALLLVFGLRPLAGRAPRVVKVILCLALVAAAVPQVTGHRRFAKAVKRQVDITQTVEHRIARWLDDSMPGRRVMMPGSIAQWLNTFSRAPQMSGGSFPTALNQAQQAASLAITYNPYANDRDAAASLLWLKAFGAQAVGVSGKFSPEFWKPYVNPAKFEGLLDVLWRESDTTIYRVPQRSDSLARVVPRAALVRRPPKNGGDTEEVERYVTALEDASLPHARSRWNGSNRVLVDIPALAPGEVVSVQINHHAGWHARAGGDAGSSARAGGDAGSSARAGGDARTPARDGLGLMWLEPACAAPCRIELIYDGGWEYRVLRWVSVSTILSVFVWVVLLQGKKRGGEAVLGV